MTTDQSILDELYKLDPSLKEHEARLLELIKMMREQRPDVTPDPQFIRELRSLLLERASSTSSTSSFFTMPRFTYALTGAIVGILVAGPAAYYFSQGGNFALPTESDNEELFSYAIEPAGERAFGDLSNAQPGMAGGMGGREMGAGGGGNAVASVPQNADGAADAKMMIYPPVSYEYRYVFSGSGTLPGLTEQSIDVLKRQKERTSVAFAAIASNFKSPFIDLGSFDGATVDNITFAQRGNRGYMFNLALREGSININQNWETWPHPESACRDEACWQRYRMTVDDVLPDEQVIGIANDFAEEHGIDLSRYGAPEVNDQWRMDYERATDKSQIWIPDVQTVVYPLLVEGKPVYDESGNKSGVSINVNVRQKAVSDVWGIMDQTYSSSEYAAITDEATVKTFIEKLDAQPVMPLAMEDGTKIERKTITITLGEPQLAYAKYYLYGDGSKPADELVVPSLIFPVERTEGEQGFGFWRRAVVVPLAKELLEQRLNPQDGVVMPMGRG